MKTKIVNVNMVAALFVALIGFSTVGKAQGTVTFAPISAGDFNTYMGQAAWVMEASQTGNAILLNPGLASANGIGFNMDQSYRVSFALTETSGGAVSLTAQTLSGVGVSLSPVTISISSSVTPISGLVFAIVPGISEGLVSISDMTCGGYSSPIVPSSSGEFSGLLASFGNNTSDFSVGFNVNNQVLGNISDFYVIGVSAQAVPEPSTFSCAALCGLMMLVSFIRRK